MSLDLLLLSACLSFSVDVPLVIYVLSVESRRKWNDLEDLPIAAFIVYVYISTAAEGSGTSLWNMFEINSVDFTTISAYITDSMCGCEQT